MDLAQKNVDRQRFFVVSAGRTGSSLLAAILVDAGADFGMPRRESWNPQNGAYEHQLALRSYMWHQRADMLEDVPFASRLRTYCDRRSLDLLRTLLQEVRFVKTSTLLWLTQPAQRLGYAPSIIISYRNFASVARSRFVRSGWSLPRMVENYYESYSTALMQMDVKGGCAVDFDEMTDLNETSWADALSQVTGLSRERLLEVRASRITRQSKPVPPLLFDPVASDPRIAAVYNSLVSLKGRVIQSNESRKTTKQAEN